MVREMGCPFMNGKKLWGPKKMSIRKRRGKGKEKGTADLRSAWAVHCATSPKKRKKKKKPQQIPGNPSFQARHHLSVQTQKKKKEKLPQTPKTQTSRPAETTPGSRGEEKKKKTDTAPVLRAQARFPPGPR